MSRRDWINKTKKKYLKRLRELVLTYIELKEIDTNFICIVSKVPHKYLYLLALSTLV